MRKVAPKLKVVATGKAALRLDAKTIALDGAFDANDQRAVRGRLLGVEGALASGNALNDEACVAVDQYGH